VAFILSKVAVASDMSQTQTEQLTIRTLTEDERLKLYLYEQVKYDWVKFEEIKKVITCESEWKVDAVGDGGKAVSLCQYHLPTFEQFQKKSGIEGDYYNPYTQIKLTVWAWDNGLQRHWTCYKVLKQKGAI